jgi:ABC-type polysaccharide/polyol phosphate export permease
VLRILFFATPIFYQVDLVGEGLARTLVDLNPLYFVMKITRDGVLNGQSPPLLTLLGFIGINIVCLAAALFLFKRLEPEFAENV